MLWFNDKIHMICHNSSCDFILLLPLFPLVVMCESMVCLVDLNMCQMKQPVPVFLALLVHHICKQTRPSPYLWIANFDNITGSRIELFKWLGGLRVLDVEILPDNLGLIARYKELEDAISTAQQVQDLSVEHPLKAVSLRCTFLDLGYKVTGDVITQEDVFCDNSSPCPKQQGWENRQLTKRPKSDEIEEGTCLDDEKDSSRHNIDCKTADNRIHHAEIDNTMDTRRDDRPHVREMMVDEEVSSPAVVDNTSDKNGYKPKTVYERISAPTDVTKKHESNQREQSKQLQQETHQQEKLSLVDGLIQTHGNQTGRKNKFLLQLESQEPKSQKESQEFDNQFKKENTHTNLQTSQYVQFGAHAQERSSSNSSHVCVSDTLPVVWQGRLQLRSRMFDVQFRTLNKTEQYCFALPASTTLHLRKRLPLNSHFGKQLMDVIILQKRPLLLMESQEASSATSLVSTVGLYLRKHGSAGCIISANLALLVPPPCTFSSKCLRHVAPNLNPATYHQVLLVIAFEH